MSPVKCESCRKDFSTKYNLKRHMLKCDNGKKNLFIKCENMKINVFKNYDLLQGQGLLMLFSSNVWKIVKYLLKQAKILEII